MKKKRGIGSGLTDDELEFALEQDPELGRAMGQEEYEQEQEERRKQKELLDADFYSIDPDYVAPADLQTADQGREFPIINLFGHGEVIGQFRANPPSEGEDPYIEDVMPTLPQAGLAMAATAVVSLLVLLSTNPATWAFGASTLKQIEGFIKGQGSKAWDWWWNSRLKADWQTKQIFGERMFIDPSRTTRAFPNGVPCARGVPGAVEVTDPAKAVDYFRFLSQAVGQAVREIPQDAWKAGEQLAMWLESHGVNHVEAQNWVGVASDFYDVITVAIGQEGSSLSALSPIAQWLATVYYDVVSLERGDFMMAGLWDPQPIEGIYDPEAEEKIKDTIPLPPPVVLKGEAGESKAQFLKRMKDAYDIAKAAMDERDRIKAKKGEGVPDDGKPIKDTSLNPNTIESPEVIRAFDNLRQLRTQQGGTSPSFESYESFMRNCLNRRKANESEADAEIRCEARAEKLKSEGKLLTNEIERTK
jgi:hypothetical protein